MEVTHLDHMNTHAIIGGMAPESFGVEDNAEFYEMLSSTMYPNKKLAVVREVMCNSWDAHLMSGKTDVAVEVTISDKEMVFRDFGPGIERFKIIKIYCTYGSSTKSHDGKQTGGFGLGSKAPFAYSKHFTVVSCHDGKRTIYAASRGSSETAGKPDFRPMVADLPTDETGVTVTIPILSREDARVFKTLVRDLAYLGGMKISLNGEVLPTINYSLAEMPFIMIPHREIGEHHGHNNGVYVRYGAVVYPVATVEGEIKAAFAAAPMLESVASSCAVILLAAPDTIGVAPSRETLSYTPKTIASIEKLMAAGEASLESAKEERAQIAMRFIEKTWIAGFRNAKDRFETVVKSADIFDTIRDVVHNRASRQSIKPCLTAVDIQRAATMQILSSYRTAPVKKILFEMTEDQVRNNIKRAVRKTYPNWNHYFSQMEFGKRPDRSDRRHSKPGSISLEYDKLRQITRLVAKLETSFNVTVAPCNVSYSSIEDRSVEQLASAMSYSIISDSLNPRKISDYMEVLFAPSRAACERYLGKNRAVKSKHGFVVLTRKTSDVEGAIALMQKFGFKTHDARSFVKTREVIAPSKTLYLLAEPLMDGRKRMSKEQLTTVSKVYDAATSTAKYFCYGAMREFYVSGSSEVEKPVPLLNANAHAWVHGNLGEVVLIFNAADARLLTKAGLINVHEALAEKIAAFAETEAGAASLLHETSLMSGSSGAIVEYFSRSDISGQKVNGLEIILADLGIDTAVRKTIGDEDKSLLRVIKEYEQLSGGKYGAQVVVAALDTVKASLRARYSRLVEVVDSKEFGQFRECFNTYYTSRLSSPVLLALMTSVVQSIAVQLALQPKPVTPVEPALQD